MVLAYGVHGVWQVWDLRKVSGSSPKDACRTPTRLANGQVFAGDVCPTAGLWRGVGQRERVLLSSTIAWWTDNKEVSGPNGGQEGGREGSGERGAFLHAMGHAWNLCSAHY